MAELSDGAYSLGFSMCSGYKKIYAPLVKRQGFVT